MLYQRFGQGVSNLSTVAELWTFDGTGLTSSTLLILLSSKQYKLRYSPIACFYPSTPSPCILSKTGPIKLGCFIGKLNPKLPYIDNLSVAHIQKLQNQHLQGGRIRFQHNSALLSKTVRFCQDCISSLYSKVKCSF